jgi:hypothetical protein
MERTRSAFAMCMPRVGSGMGAFGVSLLWRVRPALAGYTSGPNLWLPGPAPER